jgi:ATP-dependent Clp protease ATP-binding subunit ClpX
LVKQFTKLFQMDNMDLEFQPGSLEEIAGEAKNRGTGARALRAIIENIMLDAMFDAPSLDEIERVVIPSNVISDKATPILMPAPKERRAS